MEKKRKIKMIFKEWPMHTALPIAWLLNRGFSLPLIHSYIRSGWLKSLSRGLVARADDKIEWGGFVWALQRVKDFHIGGKTALEVQGRAHFVKFYEHDIFLYCTNKMELPSWMRALHSIKFKKIRANLLPNSIGLKEQSFGEYSLTISNPARAFVEYMHLAGKIHSFDEAYYLMENLEFLDPVLMQEVLESCTSNRVKRLVLCLAKKQSISWFKNLDLTRITLGKGIQQIVKGGVFDPDFMIMYPPSWDKEDEPLF